MNGLAGYVLAAGWTLIGPVLLAAGATWNAVQRRRLRGRRAAAPRRAMRGRISVDPQYVRERFAEVAAHAPRELRRPDPRIFGMYLVPAPERED